ncbi:hypothetical protein Tco_0431705 [Tanacetum coccineum]
MLTHAAEGEGSGEPTKPLTLIHSPTQLVQVQTPHDSPILGGHTSDRAKGVLNLHELSVLCTNLSNRVLALESIKDAQAAEISALKIRIKSTVFDDQDADHSMEYMETEEVVDEGRQSGETREVKLTDDTDVCTIPYILKVLAVAIFLNDVDDSSRPERSILTLKPLPIIDPKDKGKGVLKESPVKKVKRSNLDAAQIAKDAEIARLIHEKELAEMEREIEERQRQESEHCGLHLPKFKGDEKIIDKMNKKAAGIDEEKCNGQRDYFVLHVVLSIFDREDLCTVYQLVMNRYQDETPEGFDRVLWGDLMIGYCSKLECYIVPSGSHTLMTDARLVIHMLVEKKYPLRKKVLLQMLELKLETEEDRTMALELIRFVKKLIVELEPENFNGDRKDL